LPESNPGRPTRSSVIILTELPRLEKRLHSHVIRYIT